MPHQCVLLSKSEVFQANDLAPIARMMELMQTYAKDDRIVGTDKFDSWWSCLAAIEALSTTMSTGLLEELKRVCSSLFDFESCSLVSSSVFWRKSVGFMVI